MAKPIVSDDELDNLTRAYLRHRNAQSPLARDFAEHAVVVAYSRPAGKPPAAALLAVATFLVAGIITAGAIVAAHQIASTTPENCPGVLREEPHQSQVEILRTAVDLKLPSIDCTVTESPVVAALAHDVRSLPAAPSGAFSCALHLQAVYTLTFSSSNAPTWEAYIPVGGCGRVSVSDGPTRVAASAALWSDLESALALPLDEVMPWPCNAGMPPGYTTCYPSATPSS
jgi:hypothetical protein